MLEQLPAEVAQRLLAMGVLGVPDLMRCAGVSRVWRAHARADWVWRHLAVRWGLVGTVSVRLADAVDGWCSRFGLPHQPPLLLDRERDAGQWRDALVFLSIVCSGRGRALSGDAVPFVFPSLGRVTPWCFHPPPDPTGGSSLAPPDLLEEYSMGDPSMWDPPDASTQGYYDTLEAEYRRRFSLKNSRHLMDETYDFAIDVHNNTMVVVTLNLDRGAQLATLDLTSGQELWAAKVAGNIGASRLTLCGDHLFVFSPHEENRFGVDLPMRFHDESGTIFRYARAPGTASDTCRGEWVYQGTLAFGQPLEELWKFLNMRSTPWGLVTTDELDTIRLYNPEYDVPVCAVRGRVSDVGGGPPEALELTSDAVVDYDGSHFWVADISPGARPALLAVEAPADWQRDRIEAEDCTAHHVPLEDLFWFEASLHFGGEPSTAREPRVEAVRVTPAELTNGYMDPRDVGTMPMRGRAARLVWNETIFSKLFTGGVDEFDDVIIDHNTETLLATCARGKQLVIIRHYRSLVEPPVVPPTFAMVITSDDEPKDSIAWNRSSIGFLSCDQDGQVLWVGARMLLVDYGHAECPDEVRVCDLATPHEPAVRNTDEWTRNPPCGAWWVAGPEPEPEHGGHAGGRAKDADGYGTDELDEISAGAERAQLAVDEDADADALTDAESSVDSTRATVSLVMPVRDGPAPAPSAVREAARGRCLGAGAPAQTRPRPRPRPRKRDMVAVLTTDALVKEALQMNREMGMTLMMGAVLTQSALWVGLRTEWGVVGAMTQSPGERTETLLLCGPQACTKDFVALSLDWGLTAAAAIHPPAVAAANIQLAFWPEQGELRKREQYCY